jgi:hypothetical protein
VTSPARSPPHLDRRRARGRGHRADQPIGIDGLADKHVLGLVEGDTENAAAVQTVLDNLVERVLDPKVPRLFILDGTRALSKAALATFLRPSGAASFTSPAKLPSAARRNTSPACAGRCARPGKGRRQPKPNT